MDRANKSTPLIAHRTALLRRGFTLRAFSQRYGFSYHSTRAALAGKRHGTKARAIVSKAKEVARG